MLRLAVVLPPFADEGFQGYLARLAEANAVSMMEITEYYRSSMSSDQTIEGLEPTFWEGMRCHLLSQSSIPMSLWNSRGRRFCPICLQKDNYWRGCWELSLVTECHEHKVCLVQDCPSCSAPLTWYGKHLLNCGSCGESLFDARVDSSDASALWLSSELSWRLSNDQVHYSSGFGALNLGELHKLAVRFGARISEASQSKPLKIKSSSSLIAARRVSSAAADLLHDWPRSFNRHLRELVSKNDRNGWKMASRFGRLYEDIYRNLGESCFHFVRAEFESTLATEWHGPVGYRNRRLSKRLVESPLWVPVKSAAIRTKVDMSLIRRMAERGEIQIVRQRHDSGRTNTLVSIDELRKLSSNMPFACSLEEASSCLGLPERRVRQMLEAGILHYYGGSPSKGERWWVSNRSLSKLACMGSRLDQQISVQAETETLSDCLRYRLKKPEQAMEVICRIIDGRLTPVGRCSSHEQVGSWLLRINDLIAICEEPCSDELFTIKNCASSLQVKEQVAYDLTRLGLVKSVKPPSGDGKGIRVSYDALAEFKNMFVLGRDIAAHLGRSPRWLAQNLLSSGFMPVAGPGIINANCRQYVWRRSTQLDHYIASIT